MPAVPVHDPTFRVEFDLAVLAEDSGHSTPKGRSVMRDAMRELDRNGIPASRLQACEDPGAMEAACPDAQRPTYRPQPASGAWSSSFASTATNDHFWRAWPSGFAIPPETGSPASTKSLTAGYMVIRRRRASRGSERR